MSLINDMLRDIDDASGSSKSLGAAEKFPKDVGSHSYRRTKLGVFVVVVLLLVVIGWQFDLSEQYEPGQIMQSNLSDVSVASSSQTIHRELLRSAPSIQSGQNFTNHSSQSSLRQDDLNTKITELKIAPIEPVDVAKKNRGAIDTLLKEAALALSKNHLMTPIDHNAYQLYRSVLLLEPESGEAQAGLKAIHNKYVDMAFKVRDAGNLRKSKFYLERAKLAFPDSRVTLDVEPKIGVADDFAPVPAAAENSVAVTSEELDSPNTMLQTTSNRVRSDTNSGDSVNETILRDIRKGYSIKLLDSVKGCLLVEQCSPSTIVRFAKLLASQKRRNQLEELSLLLNREADGAYWFIRAQIAVLDEDYQLASKQAEMMRGFSGFEEDSLRLSSAICQWQNNYSCSLNGYLRLTAQNSAVVSDWLGVAVSAEQMGKVQLAKRAYEKVLENAGRDSPLYQFSHRKLLQGSVSQTHR